MGRTKLLRLTPKCPMGKALYKVLEFGHVGNKKIGYRMVYPNELIVAPVRICRVKRVWEGIE